MRMTDALKLAAPTHSGALDGLLRTAPHDVGPDVSCWEASLDRLDGLLAGVQLEPLMPDALRRAVRKRQIAHLGGRLCAEHALSTLGAGASNVSRNERGAPVWPLGTTGSIAHTAFQAYAGATWSDGDLSVGIDSEIVSCDMYEAITEFCCTAGERTRWFRESPDPALATLIFSAKESFYKAVEAKVMRFVDFQEVEVISHDRHRRRFELDACHDPVLQRLARSASVRYRTDGPTVHTTVLLSN